MHVAWFRTGSRFRDVVSVVRDETVTEENEERERERERERGKGAARGGKARSAAAKTAGYDTTSPTVATRLNFQPGGRSSLETAAPPTSARKLLRRLTGPTSRAKCILRECRERGPWKGHDEVEKITFHPIGTAPDPPVVRLLVAVRSETIEDPLRLRRESVREAAVN